MKFHTKEVLNDVWMQFLVLCLLTALSVDSLKYVHVHSFPSPVLSRFMLGFVCRVADDVAVVAVRSRP